MSEENNNKRLEDLHPPPISNASLHNFWRLGLRYISETNQTTSPVNNRQNNNIRVFNLISLREEMLVELERLRNILNEYNIEEDEDYLKLSDDKKEKFHKFIDFFSICPICKSQNHKKYLYRFFFSADPNKKLLKKRLLRLIEEMEDFNEIYYNNISLGIPCCNCYKIIFGEL
ncbi:MAG: hypothetical protein ACTSQJ_11805 [Promethearchaeota archaeon]